MCVIGVKMSRILTLLFCGSVSIASGITVKKTGDLNGVLDEEREAIVTEAFKENEELGRSSRQLGGFANSQGRVPANTIPLSPIAQLVCRTPSGGYAFCTTSYQFGGGQGWPGITGHYPGAGIGGQYPPWGQYPGAGPRPTKAPAKPPVSAVVVEEDSSSSTGSAAAEGCGVGKYYPIRYNQNGSVAEEEERTIGDHGFRVVNGWPADEGEWPWIAALLNNNRQFCGGSLIDSKHILTAAHCVAHMSRYDVANLKVRLGDYKIKTVGETKVFESKAARVVRHKGFSQQTLHQDVAIITLETPVPAGLPNVRPVCLPPQGGPSYAGQTATVVGWGSLKENGAQPDVLMEVTVKIWENSVCKETYGNAAPGGILPHMLCAGQKGKDSCSGDSGGPMQIGSGSTWTQIGVVSWGIGCGKSHYPGVYSRVTELRDWIDRIRGEY